MYELTINNIPSDKNTENVLLSFFNWAECKAVDGARSGLLQSGTVLPGAVPFMAREAIAWILFLECDHISVTLRFRQN